MQKNPSLMQRPTSGKVYRSNIVNYVPAEHQQVFHTTNERFNPNQILTSIPLNHRSTIINGSRLIENNNSSLGVKKNALNFGSAPQTKKIFFNYFSPENRVLETRYIQTVIHTQNRQQINEWQARYIELEKNLSSFIAINERMSQQLLKITQEMKFYNESMTKTQSQVKHNYQQQIEILNKKLELSNEKFQQMSRESKLFKDQNVRLQNMIERLQSESASQKSLVHKLQSQNNQLILQIKQLQFDIRDLKSQNSELQPLKDEIYDLKMKLAQKNIQLEQLLAEKNKREDQRTKTIQKLVQQRIEQKLTKIRTEYEKKQKKIQKQRIKEISELKLYIQELEIRERGSKELKQKYEKMYNEKKEELDQLRNLQQSTNIMSQNEKQIYLYEQRIQQLNKIAAQKEKRIIQLEDENKKQNETIQKYQENWLTQKQIDKLHQIIEEQQDKLLSAGGVNYDPLNNKVQKYFNGHIFQQKLIYQLKKDNQKLIQLLGKMNFNQKMERSQTEMKKKDVADSKQPGSCQLTMDMKSMIKDIFYKVELVAELLKQTVNISSETLIRNYEQVSPKKTKRSKSPKKHKKQVHECNQNNYSNNSITIKISQDIQILKVYMVDLGSTCDRLFNRLEQEQQSRYITSRKQRQVLQTERKITEMVPKDMEIIEFYKSKNLQLQSRIDELLILNDKFKEKLCEKSDDKFRSGQTYWKNQANKLKQQIQHINGRYQILSTQFQQSEEKRQNYQSKCALYSMEIERLHLVLNQNEHRLQQINSLVKQVQEQRILKTKFQREISIWQHKYQDLEARFFDSQKSATMYLKEIDQQRFKLEQIMRIRQSLQIELVQLTKKFETQNRSNSSLRISFQELTNKLSSQEGYDQKYFLSKNQVQNQKRINSSLQSQLNDLKNRIKQLQQINSSLQSSLSEYRTKIQQQKTEGMAQFQILKKSKVSLESQVLNLRAKIDQLTKKNNIIETQGSQNRKKLDRLNFLQSQNMQLKSHIQKISGIEHDNNELRIIVQRLSGIQSENIKLTNRLHKLESLQLEINQLKIKLKTEMNNNNMLKYELAHKQKQKKADGGSIDPYMLQKLRSRIILSQTLTRELRIENCQRNRQVNLNLDKNYQQLLNLISLFSTFSSSSLKGQDNTQIQQYILKIQHLQRRISQIIFKNKYSVEMLRSLLIEVECLAFEIKVTDNRDRQIIRCLGEELKKGFLTIATFDLFEQQ